VVNEGPGIEPESITRLFKQFSRLPVSDELGIPGSGLGLYISKRIVEAHGGRIGVRSDPGRTTTFFFSLPRAPEDVAPGATTPTAAGGRAQEEFSS
jgi:signal transduction histidine kinase